MRGDEAAASCEFQLLLDIGNFCVDVAGQEGGVDFRMGDVPVRRTLVIVF